MILGIGIDIIEIVRIQKACLDDGFRDRIYTRLEQEYFKQRNDNPQSMAGNFAAKEALSKALGTGFGKIGWTEVEVLRDNNGKPYINLYGRAAQALESLGGRRIFVSISHSIDYAVAQVIIEN